jgi:peptidoglycan/LPS O-acetylase OafA/YrhL
MTLSGQTSPARGPVNASSRHRSSEYFSWVDVIRLLAAVGVVLIHMAPRQGGLESVAGWFNSFSVPFFLIASLFLAIDGFRNRGVLTTLKSRSLSLISMLWVWTLIHTAAQALARHSLEDVVWILPRAMLTGSAGVQLYFLPALLIGIFGLGLLWLLAGRIRIPSWAWLIFGIGLAFWFDSARQSLQNPGRMSGLGGGSPILNEVVSTLTTWWSWVLWTLPFGCIALGLHQALRGEFRKSVNGMWLVGALGGCALATWAGSGPVTNLLLGASGLTVGVSASRLIVSVPLLLARWLGFASIVIYLIHHLVIETAEQVVKRGGSGFKWDWSSALTLLGGLFVLTLVLCVVSSRLPRSIQNLLWGHATPN